MFKHDITNIMWLSVWFPSILDLFWSKNSFVYLICHVLCLESFVVHLMTFIITCTWWQLTWLDWLDSTQVPQDSDYHTFASESALTLLVIRTTKCKKKKEKFDKKNKKVLTFHMVGMSPGKYICLIGWVHCLFCLVLHIVSVRVCYAEGHDICLVSLHGWWIYVHIGNWIVVLFHGILIIGNACHWTFMLLITLCLGWGHGQWNCQWWLVVSPLDIDPILQGWFGGGWRFSIHSKVLLFLIQIQMTWHVWLFQR